MIVPSFLFVSMVTVPSFLLISMVIIPSFLFVSMPIFLVCFHGGYSVFVFVRFCGDCSVFLVCFHGAFAYSLTAWVLLLASRFGFLQASILSAS